MGHVSPRLPSILGHFGVYLTANYPNIVQFAIYTLSSDRQHLSYDGCLDSGGKRKDYQNCSVLYCVLKLYTVMSTLDEQFSVLSFVSHGPFH